MVYENYTVKLIGVLDKFIIETLICFAISFIFYYGCENVLIKMGQYICSLIDKIIDNNQKKNLTRTFKNVLVSVSQFVCRKFTTFERSMI